MATVTVSASTTLALLTYAADDDIVITGAATLTCDSNPNALPAIRSIRSSSPRATFKVRNSATAFSVGNLWKLSFTNPGSAIGAGQATLGFTSGATMDFEGEWLTCYTATGVASETVLDASNVLGVDIDFPYFIEAETAAGSGVYKAVPVAVIGTSGNGFLTTVAQSAFGTGDVGRVLFYDHATRLLKTGDGTNGSLFASGIKFRIPNIYIHMPAFTLAVAAGGWTTGTGAQNVVASANAPTLAAGNVNYTASVECFNISALPSGTSVTVNNRASDGTTATAFTAGTVLYALPTFASTMAGTVSTQANGVFRSKKCMFGRWIMARPESAATWDMEDTGFVANAATNVGLFLNGVVGLARMERGVVYANIGRGASPGLNVAAGSADVYVNNVLFVAQTSTVSLQSYQSGTVLFNIPNIPTLKQCDGNRIWRIGIAAAMSAVNENMVAIQNSSPSTGRIVGMECVGGRLAFNFSDCILSGYRFSQTNGAANTTGIYWMQFGQTVPSKNLVIYDFDILSGGTAPYQGFALIGPNTNNVVIHNKIAGVVRSIDLQGRTPSGWSNVQGVGVTFAAMSFTNWRNTGQTFVSGSTASNVVIRNCRASQTNMSVAASSGLTCDFMPAPLSSAAINAFLDSGTFYAAPNTWPSLVGGIYLGPVSRENTLDQYELTAGAYTNNAGDFFIETTGDAVLFKSPKRITGVSSVTGGAVVYTAHSNITTGVTAEFRLCKWGDDITAASWGSFTGGNVQTAFAALSGYTSAIGLDFQLRFTATTTVAGRFIRQCYVPVQMDTAYNPPVGSVDITVVGAAASAQAALYDGSGNRVDIKTTDGSGGAVLAGPYDFDDVPVTGTLKIRALQYASIDTPITWTGAATVPAAMPALTGYVAGPYAGASFNKATKVVTVSSAMTTQDLWSAWREYIVQLVNFDTDDDWTYPELNAGTWEVAFSGAGSISGSYTDVNGTRAPITAPNLPVGTRVQFYNDTDNVELTNEVLAGAGASTSLYFTSAKTIRLRASKLGSLPIEAFGVMTASGLTFIDEFVTDDVYVAKGIDGSTVTEFSADEPNVQIDSDDPDGTSSVWRCYAWFRYYETSSIGVAGVLFGAAQAIDTENLAIDSARADIQLDNVSAVPLKISDGYMYRTDGATIIAPTSGSIQMDPKKAYGVDGLLSGEIEPGFDLARTLRIIAAAVAGKTTGGPAATTFRNLTDTADQITGTATEDGNRTPTSYGS